MRISVSARAYTVLFLRLVSKFDSWQLNVKSFSLHLRDGVVFKQDVRVS
jgi:hypothetical protein